MSLQSVVTTRGYAHFPAFLGERIYMREFTKAGGLPKDISRWQGTVDAMLDGVDTDGPIYLMVDQAYVQAGKTHRRGGIHIDGYWNPGLRCWNQPGPSWLYGSHEHKGKHWTGHMIEPRSGHRIPIPKPFDIRDSPRHRFAKEEWPPEAIILASDVGECCRAFRGAFDSMIGDGGDCSHIDLSKTEEVMMRGHVVYAGNVTMLHESLPVPHEVARTVVRLNVPGWSPQ